MLTAVGNFLVCTRKRFFCSFVLTQKNQKVKAANKNEHDLYQYQARPGDFLIGNRNFPVLLSIDFDLCPFLFEAGFISANFRKSKLIIK